VLDNLDESWNQENTKPKWPACYSIRYGLTLEQNSWNLQCTPLELPWGKARDERADGRRSLRSLT